jgi:hypothetical protein
MADPARDWYRLLGVDVHADRAAIKRAYLKAIRTYHPDVAGPEGEEMTALVNEAWATLSNDSKRAAYDLSRRPKDAPATTPPHPRPRAPQPARPVPKPDPWSATAAQTPQPEAETIAPHQTHWWEIPVAVISLTVSAYVLLAWTTWWGSPAPLGLITLITETAFIFATLSDGFMWRFRHTRATLAGARLILVLALPGGVFAAASATSLPHALLTLAAGSATCAAGWWLSWAIRDIRSVKRPGIGAYPVDAARVFEQSAPTVSDPLLDTLRGLSDLTGARLFHNIWPPYAATGIDHAVVVGRRVALIVTLECAATPLHVAGLAKTAKKTASALGRHLPPGHTVRVWVIADGCPNPTRVRGVTITTTPQLNLQLRDYLGTGEVRRRTLQRLWEMCA